MSATHHPSDAMLMAYGAGALGDGLALVVATHLATCPRCRAHVDDLEAVGGALLDAVEPVEVGDAALDALLARLDDQPAEAPAKARPAPQPAGLGLDILLPAPLRERLAQPGADRAWRTVAPGVRQLVVQPARRPGGPSTRLLRIAPGKRMPAHGHRGLELTLVLEGGYSDRTSHFIAGDVAEADGETDHQPIADLGRDCVCLVAIDAPVEFRGPVLGTLQKLLGR